MGNNLPESMYEYRPERTPDSNDTCNCKVCDIEITETENEEQKEMCDFCYRNEKSENYCERCQEDMSQFQFDNHDGICNDCIEERKIDVLLDGGSSYIDPSDISNIDYD